MLISHSWLKEFVDFESTPAQLSHTLNMMGIEVESYTDNNEVYKNFVTAEVKTKEKHPKADKLSLCTVFDGTDERTVVCGAPNVEAGQKVVFAQPGAIVPNGGFTIEPRKIRGFESNGMICSKKELNLGDDSSGIWVLPTDTKIGVPLPEYLQSTDVIYEISITPNRADALSHIGIARVIGSIENKQLKIPVVNVTENGNPTTIRVTVENPALCPRYAARMVRNVTVKESPEWLKIRLESVGIRPRNNVVDITNYVLMECGHPLHAFDADVVSDNHIIVRTASNGTTYKTLDGKDRTLTETMLMICDEAKELGVAGVMGGENSSIKDSTKNVLIESAYFLPSSIRKTAKQLSIHSDASYRFERGTDINNIEYALNRAAQLMVELAEGTLEIGMIDVYPNIVTNKEIAVRFDRVKQILGLKISNEDIVTLLQRLQFGILHVSDSSITVSVPTYRVDVHQEIDVIEEIAILHNYDNIPLQTTASINIAPVKIVSQLQSPERRRKIREYLSSVGMNEIITQNQTDRKKTALTTETPVVIANPLGEELSLMRNSIIPSMLAIMAFNIRNGNHELRLFELGKTFSTETNNDSYISGIREEEKLCIGVTGIAQQKEWFGQERRFDIYDLKGLVQTFLQFFGFSVQFIQNDKPHSLLRDVLTVQDTNGNYLCTLGYVSSKVLAMFDITFDVLIAEIDVQKFYSNTVQHKQFSKYSLYPTVQRDLAFIVDKKVRAEEIIMAIGKLKIGILQGVRVFDLFEGKNIHQDKKSLAYKLTFGSDTSTLTDEEVTVAIKTIVQTITIDFSADLRTE